jgi:hypothetical protein
VNPKNPDSGSSTARAGAIARLTPNTVAHVRRIARAAQAEAGHLAACNQSAAALHEAFGWCEEYGVYDGPEVRKRGRRRLRYEHRWNRLPDGTIVDATANQFGDADAVRILPLGDERQAYYLTMTDEGGADEDTLGVAFMPWNAKHRIWTRYLEAGVQPS